MIWEILFDLFGWLLRLDGILFEVGVELARLAYNAAEMRRV